MSDSNQEQKHSVTPRHVCEQRHTVTPRCVRDQKHYATPSAFVSTAQKKHHIRAAKPGQDIADSDHKKSKATQCHVQRSTTQSTTESTHWYTSGGLH